MKKIILISLFIGGGIFLVSSTCDSPIVGDHSGAPGESNCSGCHSSPVNPDLPELRFEVGDHDTTYMPGMTYLVHVSIVKPSHNKFGFVCSALDTLNSSKGTFALINTAVTRTYSLGGRNYVSHTPCGADSSDRISWEFNWTAPAVDKGRITLYMSMLVANHDHALTGDTTYTRTLSLKPVSAPTGTTEAIRTDYAVYPTLFDDRIHIDLGGSDAGEKKILLSDMQGRRIKEIATTEKSLVLEIDRSVSKGPYVLKIISGVTARYFTLMKY